MANPIIMDIEELSALDDAKPEVETPPPAPASTPVAPAQDATVDAYRKALEISEAARLDMMRQQQTQQQQAQPQGQKWYTDEELVEMMQSDDPRMRLAAARIESQQQLARGAQVFEQRLSSLSNSMHTSAEASARQKYSREFELFGSQIKEFASRTDPGLLTSAATWDNLIAYVRGLPGNFEALVRAHTTVAPEVARGLEGINAGASFTTPPAPSPSSAATDPVTREIALGLGYPNVEAYLKDMRLLEKHGGVFNG